MAVEVTVQERKELPTSGNSVLNSTKYSSRNTDEWYTPYYTISEELAHYKDQFKGKVVLCNCDDPYSSNFCLYFLRHFNQLQLKKLICTSYAGSKIDQIHDNIQLTMDYLYDDSGDPVEVGQGYVLTVSKMPGKAGKEVSDNTIKDILRKKGVVNRLKGSGDFRSEECVEFLKECDICCTNPPFSLFASLFSLIVKYNKQYLLIGNQNAITYKEIFPYIKENKAWVGYRFGDMAFRVPADSEPRKTRFWIDESGQKWRSLGNAMWLTNLDIPRRHQELVLTQHYDPRKYPKYDNFDGINVQKVTDIPMDFDGIMGVPITYLKYHNGVQFEIVGEANHGSDNEFDLFKPKLNGKELFKRILIRRIHHHRPKEFKILDLFCGAGGLSWGMDKNPYFSTTVALDFDKYAVDTFKKNMPYTEVVVGDITSSEVKDQIISLAQKTGVNMIVGGPPCQGYSTKGKKLGLQDPRNFLFREYLHLVHRLQPDVFVIENVKGLLLAANGWFKDQIVQAIEALGYTVRFNILNAANYGVPQARERAIFICSKHGAIDLPEPTVSTRTTVRDAISDLAYLESNEGGFELEYTTEPQSDYQILMRFGSKKLYNHQASKHKQIAIDKLKLIPPEQGKEFLPEEMQGKQQFRTTWGRLKWDEVSPTIDTRFDASSNGTNNHPFLNRAITPREAARIQSFDDCFAFYGSKVYVRKQVGNAVPPLLAKAIADRIADAFGLY